MSESEPLSSLVAKTLLEQNKAENVPARIVVSDVAVALIATNSDEPGPWPGGTYPGFVVKGASYGPGVTDQNPSKETFGLIFDNPEQIIDVLSALLGHLLPMNAKKIVLNAIESLVVEATEDDLDTLPETFSTALQMVAGLSDEDIEAINNQH